MTIRAQINIFTLFVVLLLGLSFFQAQAEDEIHPLAEPSRDDERSYHLAVGEYFQVPEAAVAEAAAVVGAVELPVVFFVARYGLTEPREVMALRQAGQPWQTVAAQRGLGPESFYYPLPIRSGRTLATAYEKFDRRSRSEWKQLELTDEEIVSLVNLRFLAEHSGHGPSAVADLRADGHDFMAIHGHLKLQASRRAEGPRPPEPATNAS